MKSKFKLLFALVGFLIMFGSCEKDNTFDNKIESLLAVDNNFQELVKLVTIDNIYAQELEKLDLPEDLLQELLDSPTREIEVRNLLIKSEDKLAKYDLMLNERETLLIQTFGKRFEEMDKNSLIDNLSLA